MSIVYNYGDIGAQMKGDTWWEPEKPEAPEMTVEEVDAVDQFMDAWSDACMETDRITRVTVGVTDVVDLIPLVAKPSEIIPGWQAFVDDLNKLDWGKCPDVLKVDPDNIFPDLVFRPGEMATIRTKLPTGSWSRLRPLAEKGMSHGSCPTGKINLHGK